MESTEVIMPTAILTNPQNEVTITPKPTCPWGKVATTPEAAVSFADVMSEELARALEETELVAAARRTLLPLSEAVADPNLPETDCSDDHTLALLLQSEYDKEHDTMLCREERKFNGESKVSISFGNYKRLPEHLASDSDDEEDALDGGPDVARHWDSFERAERSSPAIGRSGVARQAGGGFTTKHDATVCGRRNACRVMELPPGISTGDGGGFDMRLSNHVYNSLKVHSAQEGRRAARLHDKREKATAEQTLDPNTRLLLYKLVNREILDEVNGCISTGKESCVFHAAGGKTEEFSVPRECAVKVFKTTLNEFKNREQYIREDFRFKDRFSKLNPRKVIHLWAEKEMHNLRRMRRAGIPCPEVVVLKKHLLVMSFVGLNGVPAPQLKEAALSGEQLASAYAQAVALAQALYQRCQLVHADLSEYNLLWHHGQVLVIDVSQAVDRMHPHALEFLLRDCTNISRFFQKQGLPNVLSPKDLFTEVCGLNLPGEGAELLSQIQNYERDEQLLGSEQEQKVDLFDTLFQKSMDKKSRIGNETASSKDKKAESEESDDDVLED
ncbi:serine/threonine-protein kinase RIO3 [Ixodes scapularis]|uniref:serine/threonine-protein kinase RIO3 n=1 Tax=Ixodes scapularis TaxID=6945 RepID=UPI001A9FADD7|nr:serine/threonine-protein kinase RIO3 [Ixodes scapularis]